MKPQNYSNHVRLIPVFHFFLMPLGLITLIAAVVHLFISVRSGGPMIPPILFVALSLMIALIIIFSRSFACKAQDRAIRAEENLRHYALTGKLLDPRLTMNQIIALRFASDEELVTLCEKAANDRLDPDTIKRSIHIWKADNHRV